MHDTKRESDSTTIYQPAFSVAGIINLARSGSMKFRNSFRRHNSTHKREERVANNSQVMYVRTQHGYMQWAFHAW